MRALMFRQDRSPQAAVQDRAPPGHLAGPRGPGPRQRRRSAVEGLRLAVRARKGSEAAREQLIQRYTGFVRMKASSYFIAGGEGEDLVQEGLIGLCKAIRDYRHDRGAAF